ncbi:MAG: HNH endonuclease signature motif containing protein [Chloroflexota bacterium]|nr:HNH endonuclease signature motif containing protein [Chloroflexota bacterium]
MQSNDDIAIRAAQDQNAAAFEEQRADLELESPGLWALFRDGRLVNTYDTQQFAIESAERRFGQGPYFITQIAEEPEAASYAEHPADVEKRSFAKLAFRFAWKTLTFIAAVALVVADWIIDKMPLAFDVYQRIKGNKTQERPDKTRPRFSKKEKEGYLNSQGKRCMYCGGRFSLHYYEVDHKAPWSKSRDNRRSNLQVLCAPCNRRKGDQYDDDFRRRYASVFPSRRKTPPSPPVPQRRFDAVTRTTDRTRRAHAGSGTIVVTRQEKILGVSFFLGIVSFGLSLVGLQELGVTWDGLAIATAVFGLLVGGGLYLRAWLTGRLYS